VEEGYFNVKRAGILRERKMALPWNMYL